MLKNSKNVHQVVQHDKTSKAKKTRAPPRKREQKRSEKVA